MKYHKLTYLIIWLIFISCAKEYSPEYVKSLSERTIIVKLKTPLKEHMEALEDTRQSEKLIADYKRNVKQFNRYLKQGFNKYWDFGQEVKFVSRDDITKYKNDSAYAILGTDVFYQYEIEPRTGDDILQDKEHLGTYWVFHLQKVAEYDFEADPIISGSHYERPGFHLSFPLPKQVSKQVKGQDSLLPLYLVSVENNPIEGNIFTDKDFIVPTYSKADIFLMIQLMQHHLKFIRGRRKEKISTTDFISYKHNANCKKLQQQTLAVPIAQENYVRTGLFYKDNTEKIKKIYKNRIPDYKKETPFQVTTISFPEMDSLVAAEDSSVNYVYIYNYNSGYQGRIVLNYKGEIMAASDDGGRQTLLKHFISEFAECPRE